MRLAPRPVPSARRGAPALTLAVLGLAAMAFSVLQSLVIPVLPDIGHELHVSQQAVTWVLTGYLLSASVATPILGRLGDMFGKRRILVITMTALAAGLTYSGMPNVIVESVPAAQTGVATGMNANIRTLGSALGGQVTTSIVTTTIVTTSVVTTSVVTTSVVTTSVVTTSVVSTGVVSTGSSALGYPAGSGFTISFIVLAVVSLGAAVVAAGVRVSRRPSG